MNKEIFSVVFRELSKEIKKLNDEDIAKIVSGQAKFRLQVIEKVETERQFQGSDDVEALAGFFRELSKIKNLDDEDVSKVVGGQVKFKLQLIDKPKRQPVDVEAIAVELNSMTSNEEGKELLKERCKRKNVKLIYKC